MNFFEKLIFFFGVLLLGINIVGLFKTMRDPGIYTEENTKRVSDITLKYPDIKKQLLRKEHETDKEFAVRITQVVADGILHYWSGSGMTLKDFSITKYNKRVPVWENYLLWLPSFIKGKNYPGYEFSNYKKNLERGIGLCSSASIVLKGALNDNGIDASLWDIAGHVVTRTQVDKEKNEWWVLDADYGIIVPYDTAAIEANPEIVRPAYANLAGKYKPNAPDPYTTDKVVQLYGKDGNHIYTMDSQYENFSYWAIWIIPFVLMIPYALVLLKRK